eukprot:6562518-Lingulodinium_polyedra.AAC.1
MARCNSIVQFATLRSAVAEPSKTPPNFEVAMHRTICIDCAEIPTAARDNRRLGLRHDHTNKLCIAAQPTVQTNACTVQTQPQCMRNASSNNVAPARISSWQTLSFSK